MTCVLQLLCHVVQPLVKLIAATFVLYPTFQAHLQGGAADPAGVASPRKSRFLQEFEEAAASLPVSPTASAPLSPFHSPAARGGTSSSPAAALPAPFLALHWVGLGLHARAAHEKLQQLSVTLARCLVQRRVVAPAQGLASAPDQIQDEVGTLLLPSHLSHNFPFYYVIATGRSRTLHQHRP